MTLPAPSLRGPELRRTAARGDKAGGAVRDAEPPRRTITQQRGLSSACRSVPVGRRTCRLTW